MQVSTTLTTPMTDDSLDFTNLKWYYVQQQIILGRQAFDLCM